MQGQHCETAPALQPVLTPAPEEMHRLSSGTRFYTYADILYTPVHADTHQTVV